MKKFTFFDSIIILREKTFRNRYTNNSWRKGIQNSFALFEDKLFSKHLLDIINANQKPVVENQQ